MPITVGADPEFLVTNSNSCCDNVDFLKSSGSYGSIGMDHGGSVGEFRPAPGTPAQVTENIKKMFHVIKNNRNLGSRKIVAGGGQKYGHPIGGHIHFGGIIFGHEYYSSTRQSNRGRIRPLSINMQNNEHKLIAMLDYYLGRRLKKVDGGARSGSQYGRLSDVETKPHGFEYRTPPSWLTDPYLTESTLALAHRIATMWQLKPTVFDPIIQRGKGIARKRDYNFLIPEVDPEKSYMVRQVANFKRVVFSKTYKMDNDNCLELWTNDEALRQIYGAGSTVAVAALASRTIQLVVCQLKLVNWEQDFQEETVLKVCHFGAPEVRIYPLGEYTPWSLQLTRSIRLKSDTIYMSRQLRKFLKIKRGHQFRVRFIEMCRRNHGNRTMIEDMDNVVFFNALGSNVPALKEEICRIFETGARKKLRRNEI
jgi:hypothetical protein